ncbi:MAG: hypothetical protein ACRELA_16505 [Candidatus Rokuibacteriota bacterium]
MVELPGTARSQMEARYGAPGCGGRSLVVGGQTYTLAEVMLRLGIAFDGCRTIDGLTLGPARFVIRYYDPEDERIVAHEFDAEFRYLAEMRVHIVEWLGEDALRAGAVAEEIFAPWTSP